MHRLDFIGFSDNFDKIVLLFDGACRANGGHGVSNEPMEIRQSIQENGLFLVLGNYEGFLWGFHRDDTFYVDQCYSTMSSPKELYEAFDYLKNFCKENNVSKILMTITGRRYKAFNRLIRRYSPSLKTAIVEVNI